MHSSSKFFKDKPLFGLDVGSSSIKVMQLEQHGNKNSVRGYGVSGFDHGAIQDGLIKDHKSVAHCIQDLFKNRLIGEINTRRVAVSIPANRAFTRSITLPAELKDNELMHAVNLEAEQYIPMPIEDLYMDYEIISRNEKGIELLAVAAPKKLVDSYMLLVRMLGLEPVAFDTTIMAAGRLFRRQVDTNDIPTVLIDFGSSSVDITIHDRTIVVTGTIPGGGSGFTDSISKQLGISQQEAHIVKTKYGLNKSKKQAEIIEALRPSLETLIKEIRRMIRYSEERSASKRKIEQIITMGGGANMPGLSDYLTSSMRMPARTSDPWQRLELGKLKAPSEIERSMYVTVSGLALTSPRELFA